MCGILGFSKNSNSVIDDIGVESLLKSLYSFSEKRGHDSSGIAVVREKDIIVHKRALPASKFIKTKEYKEVISEEKNINAIIAHARMETNGSFAENKNNQPVVKDGVVTVHNGIIVNEEDLWKKNSEIKKEYSVDTEVFNSLAGLSLKKGNPLQKAIEQSLKLLKGSYSFASIFEEYNILLLATNTGSLYYIEGEGFLLFASERIFL
jgi:glucosamine 6-phosphate synthetase-like amidotransferase/phosphosugar isomerase protein